MIRFALLCSLVIGCSAFFQSSPTEKMTRILEDAEEEADYSWMSGYTLKYENCFANDNLASFLLCPNDNSCSSGCSGGAKYTVDFAFFLDAFTEAQLGARDYACEMARENCDNDDEDQCYANAGLDNCVDDDEDDFNVQEYLECAQFEDGWVGPYCADGYNIYLGYYEDEGCYTLAAEGTFESLYGYALPYSEESIITDDCANCKEHALEQDQNEGDQQDEDDVLEQCEELYEGSSLKCEDGMGGDTSGCGSIQELEENDPAVASSRSTGSSGGSAAARAFLFIFLAIAILACCGLGYFCYTKNQKVDDPTEPTTTGPGYDMM
jgi:hypothetical protein